MNESKNVRKNVSMMLTGMVIGAALTGGSIAVAAGITAEPTWQPIFVDGQQVEMEAYNIAGHNYVKLRDMGEQVGFNVYWNAGVQIDTGHPYTGIAPAASGIRVSSYKGSTLRPGDRSGLNISPSADIKSVVSTQPNVIRVENASGFWTAIAVSSGTSDVVVTDQHGKTATLTLTVVDGKQGASIPESGASQTDAARQEIVRLSGSNARRVAMKGVHLVIELSAVQRRFRPHHGHDPAAGALDTCLPPDPAPKEGRLRPNAGDPLHGPDAHGADALDVHPNRRVR